MEIRSGFISNSSSSSFIVELPKKIEEYSLEKFCELIDDNSRYAGILYQDLKDSCVSEDYISIDIDTNILSGMEKEQIISEAKNFISEKIRSLKRKGAYHYEVAYCDEGAGIGAEMEHRYMPPLKIVKKIISHH